ncbi:MAG: hypothetical protein HRU26_05790 [Psychroserpens sp.]|nr:hypothetical protein [Psychroserpens sp.]
MRTSLKYFILASIILMTFCTNASERKMKPERKALVFITGIDQDNNTYYTNAKTHFINGNYQMIEDLYSLSEVLNWIRLHYDGNIYKDIHIVSHSNPWYGLSMMTTKDGDRITESTLGSALDRDLISPLERHVLSEDAKIIFHACGLGKNTNLLKLLKHAITVNLSIPIYASEEFNVFGGKYEGHYLAKTYYGFYPTAQSPGPRQLAQEFKIKYPEVEADWESILKTRTEQLSGAMYTYKFNIPVEWEFQFEDITEIPEFGSKEDIMDWIQGIDELTSTLQTLNIPIEKYRWVTRIKDHSLFIKGKTTVLCVMQPIMSDNNMTTYLPVDIESEHYAKL